MGKHVGLARLKRKVAARGMAGVDRRGAAAKAVTAWRSGLLQDLGGEENVSIQRRTIAEEAAVTKLLIAHVNSFLIENGECLINKGKRSLFPIVAQRQSLVDSLARLLVQLGLDRQAKKVEDLDAWLERRERENAEAVNPAESESEDHAKHPDDR